MDIVIVIVLGMNLASYLNNKYMLLTTKVNFIAPLSTEVV